MPYLSKEQVAEANTRTVYRQFVKLAGYRNVLVPSLPKTIRWDAMTAAQKAYWVEAYDAMQYAITKMTQGERRQAKGA